ncbi:hypothetical protein FJ420_23350 [Mesorhizobium sp. B3-1-3]|nr:hypothetical protein FJ424_27410 [Mesorhizobium sp. B3-1-8]TPI67361.1 hypothetical protein FJ420_23350 [Mesorhizobium sp. B3-1-3]
MSTRFFSSAPALFLPSVGAAPHCPAGHFSPYSDGEKGLASAPPPFLQRLTPPARLSLPPWNRR